jgi:hypothetical protein
MALVASLALFVSGPARADEPGNDEVTLKSGGSIRGTVLVSEPGKSVEIAVMGEPQPRVVPWSDVDQVQKGKYASAPAPSAVPPPSLPPPPRAAPPAPPGPKLGDPGVARVHIDSPVPVVLVHERDVAYPVTESWVDRFGYISSREAVGVTQTEDPLCSSPCDRVIGDSNLRIVGKGVPSSSRFDFRYTPGDVTLHVRPGHYAPLGGGIAAMVLGSLAVIGGVVLIPVNQTASTTTDVNTGVKVHVPNPGLTAGSVALIAGGAAIIGGGVALFLSGRTTLSFDQRPGAAGVKPRYWIGEF